MSNRTEWDDVFVHVHHRTGPISMELNGSGPLKAESGVQLFSQNPPVVSLGLAADGDGHDDQNVALTLKLSQDTARELGEWLIEHADDEPESVDGPAWGDDDE